MNKPLEQLKAIMLGHAVGDALGVPVEFCEREELDKNPVTTMIGWGSYPVPAGCWSDDTSMSLATLDSLKDGNIDYELIMQNFVRWFTEDEYTPTGEMFDIGKTCMSAIRNYLTSDGKPSLECGLKDERSNGNGSLMRIHPMAFYLHYKKIPYEEAIEIIHNTSSITHAHPISKIACGIYSSVLWSLLENPCKESIINGLNKARHYYGGDITEREKKKILMMINNPDLSRTEHDELMELLWSGIDVKKVQNYDKEIKIFEKMLLKPIAFSYRNWENNGEYKPVTKDEIKSTGYVVDTIEAAIWCILTTKDYKECVTMAVNLGGDTDTIAAVAGGLAGALYGINSIPIEWLETLKKRDYIEQLCEKAFENWTKN